MWLGMHLPPWRSLRWRRCNLFCKTETSSLEHLLFPTVVCWFWRMTAPMTSSCNSGSCFFGVGVTEDLYCSIKTKTLRICFFLTATRYALGWSSCLSSIHQGSLSPERRSRKSALELLTSLGGVHLVLLNSPAKRLDKFFPLFCCHSLYLSPFIYLASLETAFFNGGKTSPLDDLCFTSPPSIACGFVFLFPALAHPSCCTIHLSDSSWLGYLHFESKLSFTKCLLAFSDDSLIDLGCIFHHCPFKSVVLSFSLYPWCVLLVFAKWWYPLHIFILFRILASAN